MTPSPRILLPLCLLLIAGCGQSFARLDGVLVETKPNPRQAQPGDTGQVAVNRAGQSEAGRRSMAIRKGDAVATAPDGVGLMRLADGYEVIVDPGTDLTIENPSIFLRAGRVIVKTLQRVRDALTVKTVFGAATIEGTVFVFEIDSAGAARVSVVEGVVTVHPLAARWTDTTRVREGQRVAFDSLRLVTLEPFAPAAIDQLRRRILAIEQAAPPPPPKAFWQKPAVLVPAAAAAVAAVVVLTSGSDSRDGTVTVHIPF